MVVRVRETGMVYSREVQEDGVRGLVASGRFPGEGVYFPDSHLARLEGAVAFVQGVETGFYEWGH